MLYLRALQHKNVVELIDVIPADQDRDLYLVMEYCDTDLRAALNAQAPLFSFFCWGKRDNTQEQNPLLLRPGGKI